jgi:hypothetical protein
VYSFALIIVIIQSYIYTNVQRKIGTVDKLIDRKIEPKKNLLDKILRIFVQILFRHNPLDIVELSLVASIVMPT